MPFMGYHNCSHVLLFQQFSRASRPGCGQAHRTPAESATGFDDGLQRTVRENCRTLRFRQAEFENPQG